MFVSFGIFGVLGMITCFPLLIIKGEEIGFEPILRQISTIKDSFLDNNSIIIKYGRAIYDSFKKEPNPKAPFTADASEEHQPPLQMEEEENEPFIYENGLQKCPPFYSKNNTGNLLVLEEEIIKNELYRVTDGKRDYFWRLYTKDEDYKREERFFSTINQLGGHPNILKGHCSMREEQTTLLDDNHKILYGNRNGILMDTYPIKLSSYNWSLQGSKKFSYSEEEFKKSITLIFNTIKWLHSKGWIHGNIESTSTIFHRHNLQPIITSFICSHPKNEKSPCSNWNNYDKNVRPNYESSDMWNLASLISSMSTNYYLLGIK